MKLLLICLVFFILLFIILFIIQSIKIRKLSAKPKNNVHFYVARDKNGDLYLYIGKPIKGRTTYKAKFDCVIDLNWSNIENYGLNKNDYVNLKWEDEPVEVFLNLKN